METEVETEVLETEAAEVVEEEAVVEEEVVVEEEAAEVAVEEDMVPNGNLLPNLVDWLELVKLNLSKKFTDSPSQSKNIK